MRISVCSDVSRGPRARIARRYSRDERCSELVRVLRRRPINTGGNTIRSRGGFAVSRLGSAHTGRGHSREFVFSKTRGCQSRRTIPSTETRCLRREPCTAGRGKMCIFRKTKSIIFNSRAFQTVYAYGRFLNKTLNNLCREISDANV